MLTARETIRPSVTSDTSDWIPITVLAMYGERHRVGRREGRRVGQRDVHVVQEVGPPAIWMDSVVGHLREEEVGAAVGALGATAGPAAVELPVPDSEDQEVREPDDDAGADQVRSVAYVVPQQVVGQRTERDDV